MRTEPNRFDGEGQVLRLQKQNEKPTEAKKNLAKNWIKQTI